jgi:hypothetical protein
MAKAAPLTAANSLAFQRELVTALVVVNILNIAYYVLSLVPAVSGFERTSVSLGWSVVVGVADLYVLAEAAKGRRARRRIPHTYAIAIFILGAALAGWTVYLLQSGSYYG